MRVGLFHNRYLQRGGEDSVVDLTADLLSKDGHEVRSFLVHNRDAIEGRYERGLRGTTLAEALETSLENARKIVQRARGKLLRCMKTRVAWERRTLADGP